MRNLILGSTLAALTLIGCKGGEEAKTETPVVVPAEEVKVEPKEIQPEEVVVPKALPTSLDFEDEAEAAISDSNYKEVLTALEKEIDSVE